MPTFPEVSGSFIVNQLIGLLEAGHEVDIFAGRPQMPGPLHEDIIRHRLLERTHYWAPPRHGLLARLTQGMGLLLKGLTQAPGPVLKSIRGVNYFDSPPSRGFLRMAAKAAGHGPYDVVHCHFGQTGLLCHSLRRVGLLAGPLVTTFHGNELRTDPRFCSPERYAGLFTDSMIVTANSTYTARWLEDLGCPPGRIVKLPMGLYLSRFPFRERRLQPGEPVRLITVGRLHEVKGMEFSIRAVALVSQHHSNIEYRIVGDGPLRDHLQRVIDATGQQGRIRLLGWRTQEQLRELYAESHIFILTSATTRDGAQEAQGLVLCEAQAMGLPVLSTNTGGIPDTVIEGQSAFLVPEKDVEAIAERLSFLIEHPELWPAMGRAGRAHVEANFDNEQLNRRLIDILTRAAGGSSAALPDPHDHVRALPRTSTHEKPVCP